MILDRKIFFDAIRGKPFGGALSQGQVDGLNFKLDVWERDHSDQPLKYLAYCLATSFWETGRKMLPVSEIGKGRGRKYGRPAGPYNHIYYGRGDVQLTWHRNYVFAGKKLGIDLARYPEKALDPSISAQVLFRGCLEGWFTGKKLSDYTSYYQMRRVVNGLDRATQIARFADQFETAVNAAITKRKPAMGFTGILGLVGTGLSVFRRIFAPQDKGENKVGRTGLLSWLGLGATEIATGVVQTDVSPIANLVMSLFGGSGAQIDPTSIFAGGGFMKGLLAFAIPVLINMIKENWTVVRREEADSEKPEPDAK